MNINFILHWTFCMRTPYARSYQPWSLHGAVVYPAWVYTCCSCVSVVFLCVSYIGSPECSKSCLPSVNRCFSLVSQKGHQTRNPNMVNLSPFHNLKKKLRLNGFLVGVLCCTFATILHMFQAMLLIGIRRT